MLRRRFPSALFEPTPYDKRNPREDEEAFEGLVERFADGRKLCNCRHAYAMPNGGCYAGCSTNQLRAKHEVAARAAELLDKK